MTCSPYLSMAALCLALSTFACADQEHCPHNMRVCLIGGADVSQADGDAVVTTDASSTTVAETIQDTGVEDDVTDATDQDTALPDATVLETDGADAITTCDPGSYDAGGHCETCTAVTQCIGVLTCTSASDSSCSQCVAGYEQLADGAACTDIDECASANGGCDADAICTNVAGGRTCACKAHFSGDGLTCDPVICSNTPSGATILAGYEDAGAFTVGAVPRTSAVGDIDGDGIVDVVTDSNKSIGPGAISVRLGDGTGNFCGGADFDAGKGGYGLVLVDVNQDGRLDVAVSSFDTADVRVLLNTTATGAALTFASAVSFATGQGSSALAVGDFNGDGKKDLVTANFKASVTVLLNTTAVGASTPSFTTSSLTAGTQPNGAFVADFDGNGKDDIAIANYTALQIGSVSVFLNRTATNAATPTFDAALTLSGAGAGPDGISGGDFDEDGAPDVVVANQGEATVSVFLNRLDSTGAFAAGVKYTVTTTGTQTGAVTVADVNGDEHLDVVATTRFETTLSYGGGDGTFATPAKSLQYLATSGPIWTTVADLDGDELLDFVVAQAMDAANNVFVVLATGATANCNPGSYDAGGHCEACAAVTQCIGVLTCTSASNSHCSQCAIGYEQLANGAACTDINECASANGGCDAHANCTNEAGGRTCACKPHFSGDGFTCDPILCSTTPNGATILAGYEDGGAFAVGAIPRTTAVGDIDGDGIVDVVTDSNRSTGPGAISVRIGDGTGAFCGGADFDAGHGGYGLVLVDVNQDGRLDVAVSSFESADVRVLLNTTASAGAAPTFAASVSFATANGSSGLAVGDFNGDGKKDLVTANFNAGVSVLLNTTAVGASTPSFTTSSLTGGSQPNGAFVADFDGNGKDDIAIANYTGLQPGSASVFLNRTATNAATPTFDAALTLSGAGSGPDGISGGDFDGDGRPDVVVANQGEATVSVFLNRLASNGTFAAGVKYTVTSTSTQTGAVTVADVDGDTYLDVVATTRYETTVSYGVGDGTFAAPAKSLQYLAAGGPIWTTVADVDGDALLDFVIAHAIDVINNVFVVLHD